MNASITKLYTFTGLQKVEATSAEAGDIVMIAGRDPYSWKGITDRAKPSVRPSGEGGCSKNGK